MRFLSLRLASIIFLFASLAFDRPGWGQVAIGTSGNPTPNSKAVLLLVGNKSQGLIIPIVSNKNAVSAGGSEKGMVVFDESDNNIYYYNGTAWVSVGGGGGSQGIQINGNTVSLNSTAGSTFGLASPAPSGAGQLLAWNGTAWEPTPTPTTTGQTLSWNQTTSKWTVASAAAVTNLSGDVTGPIASTTIANTAGNSIVAAINNSATTNKILPAQITAGAANQVLTTSGGTAVWATPSSTSLPSLSANQLLSNNGSNLGISVGGDLGLTISGTTGNFSIANNAVTNAKLATGIDASKVTAGTLPSAVLPTNVLLNSSTAGGELSGTLSALTINNNAITSAKINSGAVTDVKITDVSPSKILASGASNGQVLKFNGINWVPQPDDVGGGATPTLSNGQILIGNGTANSAAALSGDATLNAGVITLTNSSATRTNLGLGSLSTLSAVTSTEITNGTIAAADLSAMGATTGQVLTYNGINWAPAAGLSSTLNSANIFVGNASNVATGVAMSGDATINQTGVLALSTTASTGNNMVTAINAGSTQINGARINANFGIGNVSTSGTLVVSGGASLNNTSLQIGPVNYTWPGTQGAASTVLTNNGLGVLTWAAGGSGWGLSGNAGTTSSNFIGTTDTQPLRFATGTSSTERMRIDGTTGNVGIGTTAPNQKLEVNLGGSTSLGGLRLANSSATNGGLEMLFGNYSLASNTDAIIRNNEPGSRLIFATNNPNQSMIMTDVGNVGIGYSSTTSFLNDRLSVAGNITADGNITAPNGNITAASGNITAASANIASNFRVIGSGNVGIGTTSPSSPLQVVAADGDVGAANSGTAATGSLRISGTTTFVALDLGVADDAYLGSYLQSHSPTDQATNRPLLLNPNGGNVGIGATTPAFPLDIGGFASNSLGSSRFFNTVADQTGSLLSAGTVNVSVRAVGAFLSTGVGAGGGFYVSSDERIKRKVGVSNSKNDLATLMKLKVTDYKFVDSLNTGKAQVKGVLAQEVEAVYPQAISKQTNWVPSIYAAADQLGFDEANQTLRVTMSKPHDLHVGDKVKLISNTSGEKPSVVSTVDGNSFTVSNWTEKSEKIFVYGKEVNDFCSVDYDRLFTLNLSATQELNKKLEAQQLVIDSLNTQNTENKKKIVEVETMLQTLQEQNTKLTAEVSNAKAKQEEEIATLKKQMEEVLRIVGAEAKAEMKKKITGFPPP